jgi:multiple sugar transport system permease protein
VTTVGTDLTAGRARRRERTEAVPYLLLAPAMLALAAVSVYPLFSGIGASVTRFRYGRIVGPAGLANYQNVAHDQTFWGAVGVTARFVALAVTVETLLGLGLALLVVRELRGVGFIRVTLILPMTVAPVVVGVIWRLLYDSQTGLVNPMFSTVGLAAPDVLAHQTSAFLGLVVVDVWEWTPLLFLIILAGLQSLPQDPLEAAEIDGAGPVRTFFDHTLPLLAPVLSVAVIVRLIDAVGTFDQIFVLTKGGPGTATQLISIYAYNTAFTFTQYGQAAAMLLALLTFVLLLIAAAIAMLRRAARRITRGAPANGSAPPPAGSGSAWPWS